MTPWTAACQASLSFTISQSLLKLMPIELMMPSNHLIVCPHPLLLLPSIFPSIRFFASSGRSIKRTLASVLPMNIQGWFSLGLTGLISLQSKALSRVFSSTTVQKNQFFGVQPSLWSSSHICTWLLEKNTALTIRTFVGKVTSLLFNMLSRFVIVFLPNFKIMIKW